MKHLFLIQLSILLGLFSHLQPLDCSRFRNGKFKMTYEGRTTIINRSGTHQIETLEGNTSKIDFNVKWINNCTYILIPTEAVLKLNPSTPKNATVTVRITAVTKNSYTQFTSSNFSSKTFTCEMFKIN